MPSRVALSVNAETGEGPGYVHINTPPAVLLETALGRREGVFTSNGAFCVNTGKYTGRSPGDKFIASTPDVRDRVWWGSNQPLAPEQFDRLYAKVAGYLKSREVFIFDGFAGADPRFRVPIRIINELAWQNLFVQQLFLPAHLDDHASQAGFTVISVPGFKADPVLDGTRSEAFIIINFERRIVLIGGTNYAGEIKKSVFSLMNYLMPGQNVLPMHCSANTGAKGDVTIFFGLSGTGKTTLSADPGRRLIGDDEHGWSETGVFNFEGGCYAKCIRLSRENEPQIWEAIRFGTVLENVYIDPETREADFDKDVYTENTRAAYPLSFIPGAVVPGTGGHPDTIIFLAADAFGVLPPVAKLTKEQAMYHFLSGYTSKLAGTERGITEPKATFSVCFGAPFLPLPPGTYARLLGEKLSTHGTNVYLINTGWSGGPYGVGDRIKLPYTRAMVRAIQDSNLEQAEYTIDPIFKLMVPTRCPGVPAEILQPRLAWRNQNNYEQQARELARRFAVNISQFSDLPPGVLAASPTAD